MYPSTLLKSYHKHSPFNFSPILYLKHYPLHLVHSHPSSIPPFYFITPYSSFLSPNSIISSFLLFIYSTTTSILNSPLFLTHSHSLFLKTHHRSPQKNISSPFPFKYILHLHRVTSSLHFPATYAISYSIIATSSKYHLSFSPFLDSLSFSF